MKAQRRSVPGLSAIILRKPVSEPELHLEDAVFTLTVCDKMRVLLISAYDCVSPVPTQPLALSLLKPWIERYGHTVQALDLFWSDSRERTVSEHLESFKPQLIGISIKYFVYEKSRTGQTQEEILRTVMNAIRSRSEACVVLGGPGFATAPEYFMTVCRADFGIVGDGEKAVVDLVSALENRQDPSTQNIEGLVYQKPAGDYHIPQPAMFFDTQDLPIPDRSLYSQAYRENPWMMPVNGIQTCRGCSMPCIMCNIGTNEGKIERTYSPEVVVAQVKTDLAQGYGGFFLADAVFNRPLEHAHRVCDALIANGINADWTTQVNPWNLPLDLLRKMRQTGCRMIAIGADSCDAKMLRNLRKGFTVDAVVKAVERCREADIVSILTLCVGGPGETNATIENTFNVIDTINPDVLLTYFGFRIYPNTELAAIARREGYFAHPSELIQPLFYESKELPHRQFVEWYAQRYKNFKRIDIVRKEREMISWFPPRANVIGGIFFRNSKPERNGQ